MRIDAHHHFWRFAPDEYRWISDDMRPLRRDFLPKDFQHVQRAAGIDASVVVQARQNLKETQWLTGLAKNDPSIRGVVGWLPLLDGCIEEIVETLAVETELVGARHHLQDEAVDFFALPEFDRGIRALTERGLSFDLLIHAHQLEAAVALVDRHPQQLFILDHCGKPRIREGDYAEWAPQLHRFAQRPNCCCKISGLVTEADWQSWSPLALKPYLDTVLACFGADRIMFGSDWPVCTLAADYDQWVGVVNDYTSMLSETERQAIWGRTAAHIYQLDARRNVV